MYNDIYTERAMFTKTQLSNMKHNTKFDLYHFEVIFPQLEKRDLFDGTRQKCRVTSHLLEPLVSDPRQPGDHQPSQSSTS